MTIEELRDQLAMAALTGILSRRVIRRRGHGTSTYGDVCKRAYSYADAMLAVKGVSYDPTGATAYLSQVLEYKP